MLRFEKAMYENPAQDLNKLWWDLVEKYQQVKQPKDRDAPVHGSKIHVAARAVYYHSYYGEGASSFKVHHALSAEVAQAPRRCCTSATSESGSS